MRSFSLLHVQQVVDVLSALLCFALSLAKKHSVMDPIPTTISVSLMEAIDPDQFMESEELQLPKDDESLSPETNELFMQRAICRLCLTCQHCLWILVRSVSSGREFFDVLENVLFLQEDVVRLHHDTNP